MIKFTKGNNCLKIRDLVSFTLLDPKVMDVRDDFMSLPNPGQARPQAIQNMPTTGQGLKVRLAATHAGIITRNNGFYTPDKMRRGASTFVDHFPKPVLVHHQDDHSDPIGRIIEARYVDTSGLIKDKYKLKNGLVVKDRYGKEKGVITEKLISDFVEGKMPFGMQVDTICTLLRDSLLEEKDYEGLGHIELIANITDAAAIPKLLDGRYLTGSVGATTDRAVCSVCKQDWTEDGKCEHKPGAIYDGAKCFIIAGDLVYDEYSFVNVPADRHSKVLELHYNGIRDSINIAEDYTGRIYEVQLGFPQYDSVTKEETEMTVKVEEIKDSLTADPAPESKTEETKVEDKKPAFLEKGKDGEKDEDKDKKKGKKAPKKKKDSEEHEDDCDCDECEAKKATLAAKKDEVAPEVKNAATEEDFDTFITRVLSDAKLSEKDHERLYEMMWEEIENAAKDGELTTEIKDAKLSTKKRKGLAKSTFCGPNKSFPVPDCAHVTAARRLVGRYKGPGDKSSILSCVSRKAKALGCGGGEKKKDNVVKDETVVTAPVVETAPVTTEPVTTTVADESHDVALLKMFAAEMEKQTGKRYETPVKKPDEGPTNAITPEEVKALRSILMRLGGLLGRDALVQALTEEELALAPECEKALMDEVVKTEETICVLRDELDALRKEYTNLFKDMETLQDAVTNSNVASRKAREAHLKTLMTLRDKKLVTVETFTTLSDEAVDKELEKISSEVDMVKITDKLGDGMSREPIGTIVDPTLIQDNKVVTQKREFPVEDLVKIQEQFYKILFSKGQQAAEDFMVRMKAEGKVPSDDKK